VQKNDCHRVFEHGKSERAEEDHRHEKDRADHLPMLEEIGELADDRPRLAGHQPFEVSAGGRQQFRPIDEVRESNHDQDQQRHD